MSVIEPNETTATIAASASLSGAVQLDSAALVGLQMPAAWTAANLTLQASSDGVTYGDVYDKDGFEVVIVAAAGRWIDLNPADFIGKDYIKLRSGTSGTPVVQASERIIGVIMMAE